MTERQWREVRYKIDPENIYLVSSAVFADNLSAIQAIPFGRRLNFSAKSSIMSSKTSDQGTRAD
jgi:alpha-amylase